VGRKVAEACLVLSCGLAASCATDHHVSPWGEGGKVSVDLYVPKPDLEVQLAEIDRETAALGLARTLEIPGKFGRGGEAFRIRGYAGKDPIGRPIHAVRVATGRAIVLAVGPHDAHDVERSRATELVPALLPGPDPAQPLDGAAYASGTDLNGDGSPDVVLKSDAGVLEIWHLLPLGAAAYEIAMIAPPTAAADVDRDGRVDLVGRVAAWPNDVLAPELDDVATFEGGRYSDATRAARAYHAARLARVEALIAHADKPADDVRLRHAIERAWHAILAGENPAKALDALDKERAPLRLQPEIERWRKAIARAVRPTPTPG
jgi:hypothetical protein